MGLRGGRAELEERLRKYLEERGVTSHWSHVITRPLGRCEATHADPGDNAAVKRKNKLHSFYQEFNVLQGKHKDAGHRHVDNRIWKQIFLSSTFLCVLGWRHVAYLHTLLSCYLIPADKTAFYPTNIYLLPFLSRWEVHQVSTEDRDIFLLVKRLWVCLLDASSLSAPLFFVNS